MIRPRRAKRGLSSRTREKSLEEKKKTKYGKKRAKATSISNPLKKKEEMIQTERAVKAVRGENHRRILISCQKGRTVSVESPRKAGGEKRPGVVLREGKRKSGLWDDVKKRGPPTLEGKGRTAKNSTLRGKRLNFFREGRKKSVTKISTKTPGRGQAGCTSQEGGKNPGRGGGHLSGEKASIKKQNGLCRGCGVTKGKRRALVAESGRGGVVRVRLRETPGQEKKGKGERAQIPRLSYQIQ